MAQSIITRIWHGMTHIKHADEYYQYLLKTGVPDYKKTPGNLSCQIWRRKEAQVCHFWTVTRWDSIESIKKFAGEEYEKARYYPEDKEYLLEFEPNVLHCETFEF
ncbi:MAG: antibiotic biosynthesis monooxygenase [Ignavibacteriales bacterium]|nr:antibiotic biosynthesis monooxygenase [Ignavibacteriales bacterium]